MYVESEKKWYAVFEAPIKSLDEMEKVLTEGAE